jgi:DNA-binding XRE family transcriptional regulator
MTMTSPQERYSRDRRPSPSPLTLCRVSRGLSQRELAELSGVCRETVCRLERGHGLPQWRTARALAAALGFPESVIFSSGQNDETQPARAGLVTTSACGDGRCDAG